MEIPPLNLCLLVCQCVQTGSYYFIWQLAAAISCRLIYSINIAETSWRQQGGNWQMTDGQIKERPCIQPTQINVHSYHKLLHLRQQQFFQNDDSSKRSLPLCTASLIQQNTVVTHTMLVALYCTVPTAMLSVLQCVNQLYRSTEQHKHTQFYCIIARM
jgi:hypothetical protein